MTVTVYDILIFSNKGIEHGKLGFSASARQRDVAGVVLFGMNRADPHLHELANSHIPCVAIEMELAGSNVASITTDNLRVAMLDMDYLVGMGHRDIGSEEASAVGQMARRHFLCFRLDSAWLAGSDGKFSRSFLSHCDRAGARDSRERGE